jgi:hypothetical protein
MKWQVIPSRVDIINRLLQIEDYVGVDEFLHNFVYKYLSIDELMLLANWSATDLDIYFTDDGVLKEQMGDYIDYDAK